MKARGVNDVYTKWHIPFSMQPVHAIFRLKKGVVAYLEGVNLLHIRFYFAQKPQRQAYLRVSNWRGQTRFLQLTIPLLQVLIAAIHNHDLPDQQYLGGILQM
ncbi:Uncharacterised protein [Citrobacter koseri]|uniref:Uncharacterized protein n=1 Tax=Citrobacter koseri TaxID=545 RepID=A0A447UMZ3_CITKO|nr:Uncharacterised protein [Citrobacter koseri]